MWQYEKKLQYPVKIRNTNPALAKVIISQYGGPDGELGASMRYLSQRFAMPYAEVKGLLTDIGTSRAIMYPPELGCIEPDKGFMVIVTNRTTMRHSASNRYGTSLPEARVKAGKTYRKIILKLSAREIVE